MIQSKSLKLSALAIAASLAVALPAMADHHGEAAVKAAVASPDRPAADKERDAGRKPVEVLTFAGLEPGMTVLDVNSATGWYTEVLARAVGENGKVYAHNGPSYAGYFKDKIHERYKDHHLPNVEEITSDSEVFDLPAGSVDMATMMLAYHDYFLQGGPDMPAVLASLRTVLKDDGVVIIVDHVAPAGTGTEAGEKYHRIDPHIVQEQMEAAGFHLAAESDVLMNPDDPLNVMPWEGDLRGHTSRFVYKFTK